MKALTTKTVKPIANLCQIYYRHISLICLAVGRRIYREAKEVEEVKEGRGLTPRFE
jgi:hypothetical protein